MGRATAALWMMSVSLSAEVAMAQRTGGGTAFFYGRHVPEELASVHDRVVVEPAHVPDPRAIRAAGAEPVAYVSVGEVAVGTARARALDPTWVVTANATWGSLVVDLTAAGYTDQLLSHLDSLLAAGYRSFFLDTLDSYQLAAATAAERESQRKALVRLLKRMLGRKPGVKLLLNRGFELLPDIGQHITAVVAESLFDRWDPAASEYVRVPDEDRVWLTDRLREAQQRHGLEAIAIDYRPVSEREAARATARAIAALGFTPWVTDAALSTLGVGPLEVLPRKVLVIGQRGRRADPVSPPDAVTRLAPALEYLGLVPVFHDLGAGLPEVRAASGYAGIISWLHDDTKIPGGYEAWLLRERQAGIPLVMFGLPGFSLGGALARELGIVSTPVETVGTVAPGHTLERDELVGFEAEPPARPLGHPAVQIARATVHLAVSDLRGRPGVAIATAPFGGVAFSHVLAIRGLSGERAWVLDPVAFLERALQLEPMPRPDLTTEAGRRVAVLAVRAHGLGASARLPGRPATATVLRRNLLSRGLPHTIEVSTIGEGPPQRADLAAAERLAKGRHVRIASQALAPSGTIATDTHRSMTWIDAVLPARSSRTPTAPTIPRMPTALDAAYVRDAPEVYPYRQVLQTLAYTDAPRRLTPIGVHYHAWAAASPGGLDALSEIYDWVIAQRPMAIFADDFAIRARAFGELVVARRLDGAFALIGGAPLRTVRLPPALGLPVLRRSHGVAAVRTLPQGTYVTFTAAGPRVLAGSGADLDGAHVTDASGHIERFSTEHGRVRLTVRGQGPLSLSLAGLVPNARCELREAGRRLFRGDSDGEGTLRLTLSRTRLNDGELRCTEPTNSNSPGDDAGDWRGP